MDPSQSPLIIYQILAGKLIGVLTAQVLVLGIFVVFLTFLTPAVEKGTDYTKNRLFKQILLFLGVTLFSAYIALIYFIEADANFTFQHIGAWWVEVANAQAQHTARILTLTLLPIDLMAIGFTASLFVIIFKLRSGRSSYLGDLAVEDDLPPTGKLSTAAALPLLFLATGAIHALFALWWSIATILAPAGRNTLEDIVYHGAYAAVHLAAALIFRLINRRFRKRPNVPQFFQYLGILIYLALTVSVYVYRTYTYFERVEIYRPDQPTANLPIRISPDAQPGFR